MTALDLAYGAVLATGAAILTALIIIARAEARVFLTRRRPQR